MESQTEMSQKKKHKCEKCPKTFEYIKDLKRHDRTHTGEKPFECKTCGKCFSLSANLHKHERSLHLGQRPYLCKICGKYFAQRHEPRHNLKNVECKTCGKVLSPSSNLKLHGFTFILLGKIKMKHFS